MSAIPTLCLLDVFQIFCGPENLGWDRNTSSRSGLEKVMFMPRFVMFFYESWITNNQYLCAQYTVYSVHEYFTLSCHQLNEFQKRQRAEICPNGILATCSPDPSNPNLCAAWLEAAWQIPLGFMYATSQPHLSFDRLDDLDIFLTQRQGSIPWSDDVIPGPFVSSNPHPLPVLRLNQQHLPSLRNPPSTSSRAISACHGRHVSDPSQSDLLV